MIAMSLDWKSVLVGAVGVIVLGVVVSKFARR